MKRCAGEASVDGGSHSERRACTRGTYARGFYLFFCGMRERRERKMKKKADEKGMLVRDGKNTRLLFRELRGLTPTVSCAQHTTAKHTRLHPLALDKSARGGGGRAHEPALGAAAKRVSEFGELLVWFFVSRDYFLPPAGKNGKRKKLKFLDCLPCHARPKTFSTDIPKKIIKNNKTFA